MLVAVEDTDLLLLKFLKVVKNGIFKALHFELFEGSYSTTSGDTAERSM